MAKNKPNPERDNQIFRDIKIKGMSHKDASAKYKLSAGRLNKILCAHPDYKSGRVGSSERNVEIAKLCDQGVSQYEVARQFKVTRSVVAAAYSRWKAKDRPDEPKRSIVRRPTASAPVVPTKEQIESDRRMIAEFIATKGVKVCPPVALVPTQATLQRNPGIDDRWNGSTGWPASERKPKKHGKGNVSSMASCRVGAII